MVCICIRFLAREDNDFILAYLEVKEERTGGYAFT